MVVDPDPVRRAAIQADLLNCRASLPNNVLSVMRTLYHPFAGCLTPAEEAAGLTCFRDVFPNRDFDAEFLGLVPGKSAQIFRNEMAALSWNLLMTLVATSVPPDKVAGGVGPNCDPTTGPKEPDPW